MRKKVEEMDVTLLESSKGTFNHFMEKEIFEQPVIIKRICKGRVNFDEYVLNAEAFHGMQDESFEKIVFVGCGTSYNAGRLGSYRIQDIAGIEAISEIASEYEYKPLHIDEKTLYVFISQS
ncbi:SIS domain-containing protein [Patescibacteria group bacterium]|nr:SIS domain-containing protein [Patescibacteria group bacterium]